MISHAINSLDRDKGGTTQFLLELVAFQSKCEAGTLSVLYATRATDRVNIDPGITCFHGYVEKSGLLLLYSFLKKVVFVRNFFVVKKPSILHVHGLWEPIPVLATFFALLRGVPVIIQPHGMLEYWSLQQSSFKKKIAKALYQRYLLSKACVVVATSEQEEKSIRAFGVKCPIAIIKNAVHSDTYKTKRLGKKSGERRVFLFLSRVHHKKGVENLLNAWAQAALENCELRIVGPGEKGYLASLEQKVTDLSITSSVEFYPEVYSEKKKQQFDEADIFVLPSFSENFGIVIVEALASGLPVITTKGTPWAEIEDRNCGAWIEPSLGALTAELTRFANMPQEEILLMGNESYDLALEYNWNSVLKMFDELYTYVLTKDKKPRFISVD